MHLFIPSFDLDGAECALLAAREIALPGDRVTVMVAVIVPRDLPVDVGAGAIWARTCRAEWLLFHLRAIAECTLPPTVETHFLRVQARDRTAAAIAGAMREDADLMLLVARDGWRGTLALRVGADHALLRDAPCPVQIIRGDHPAAARDDIATHLSTPTCRPEDHLAALQIIATNPAVAASRQRGTGMHHAS